MVSRSWAVNLGSEPAIHRIMPLELRAGKIWRQARKSGRTSVFARSSAPDANDLMALGAWAKPARIGFR